ncbi:MAG: hypothetical protein CM15mP49_33000 [Actinomycetota bacterium]|nr:MAG: hypothetical protein CM15mP49_33000 [Actinomycetota bacterium]
MKQQECFHILTLRNKLQEKVEGRILRPDVVINLPNQGSLAVDAKAPEFAEAYEKMIATESIEEQQLLLADHIKSMRAHVKTLSLKEYWNQFDRSPEFVVMFVPLEACCQMLLRQTLLWLMMRCGQGFSLLLQ